MCSFKVAFVNLTFLPQRRISDTRSCDRRWKLRTRSNNTNTVLASATQYKERNNDTTGGVLCHGELLYDLMSRTPDAAMSDATAWTQHPGGCPTNVAAVLNALGSSVTLSSPVGDDDYGRSLKDDMAIRGIDVSGVHTVAKRRTRRIFVRRCESGEREFVGYDGSNNCFADTMYMPVDEALVGRHCMIVSGTMGLAFEGSAKTVAELIASAKHAKVPVVLDVNWRDKIWSGWDLAKARLEIIHLLKQASIVKASIDDLAFLFDERVAEQALDTPEIVMQLIGGEVQGVVATAGERGAAAAFSRFNHRDGINYRNDYIKARVGAFVTDSGVVDSTGAGDAFLSGFLCDLVKRDHGDRDIVDNAKQLENMLRFAARVAGVVVSGHGASDPVKSRQQVERVIGAFGGK